MNDDIFFTISDASDSKTYGAMKIVSPSSESQLEAATDVTTLDNNVSTYFSAKKRQWVIDFVDLTTEEFAEIKNFYERQWTQFKYPMISISSLGIENVTARMSVNDTSVIDACGTISGFEATFRESKQI